MQINFAEQDIGDIAAFSPDQHRFIVSTSEDGENWTPIVDRSKSTTASPHAYVQLENPVSARFWRVENVFMPAGGEFAVSDFRLFGSSDAPLPSAPNGLTAHRDAGDRRKVTLAWDPAPGATSYLIRYGTSPHKLYQHHWVNGGDATSVTLYCLGSEASYSFRVDAMNESGLSHGVSTAAAP
jgi:hypothetical protein